MSDLMDRVRAIFAESDRDRQAREAEYQRNNPACEDPSHATVVPFDAEAAKGLTASEVRRRWPRMNVSCPKCMSMTIMYASWKHYIAGDW